MMMSAINVFADEMPKIGNAELMQMIKAHDQKTMVVMWAPWCPFCIRELKILRDNQQFISNNNLQVIAITKRRDRRTAIKYVKRNKMNFQFYIAKQEIYNKYQKIDAIPFTMVFSNKGELLDSEYGKQDIEDLALMLED
jgi:thiol-disulfide isomerase/thioredoxin